MKKTAFLFLAGLSLFLGGCETTKEISLNKDGSGILTTTSDMGKIISLAKMTGQVKDMEKMENVKLDTTFSTGDLAQVLTDIAPEEREQMKKGSIAVNTDLGNDKFITKFSLPFTDTKQIAQLDKLSIKMIQEVVKKAMDSSGKEMPKELEGGIPDVSVEDYYITTYSKGQIEKKLDKAKYANLNTDQRLQVLRQMSSVGVGNNTIIINLPSPAKKTEGKNLVLSEDKKKVTITNSADDFFSDGTNLEFKIQY